MDNHRSQLWHSQEIAAAYQNLNSSQTGLSQTEAKKRLKALGYNELKQHPPKSLSALLKEQIWDPMIFILFAASVTSALLNEWVESVVIF